MQITQKVGIAFDLTPAAVNEALANTGYDDNSAVAVIQHHNLVLFKDAVNTDFIVAEVRFNLKPVDRGVSRTGHLTQVMITNRIGAEYDQVMTTYNAENAYNDTTDPYPDDIMAPIKIDDLVYGDAFMIALGQTQPDILMEDEYSIFGVCMEEKQVLLQFEDRFVEYGFKIQPAEDGIHGTVMIQGLPVRVWDK